MQVRSEPEILRTLDAAGRLDGLPFMPEMLRFCGTTMTIIKRADKTCAPPVSHELRRMQDTVFLAGARCDGADHDGCQARCLLFWKEAWLRSADEPAVRPLEVSMEAASSSAAPFTHEDLVRATKAGPDRYVCQATQLPLATTPLPAWNPAQYVRDVTSGNVSASHMVPILARRSAMKVVRGVQARFRRAPRPGRDPGAAPPAKGLGQRSPADAARPSEPPPFDLRAGDRVRVRGRDEIAETLDASGRLRGLAFRTEMYQYCGREFTVLYRLDRTIDEGTGRMRMLRPCVVLDGIACGGDYSRFCPRGNYFYWREAWLHKLG